MIRCITRTLDGPLRSRRLCRAPNFVHPSFIRVQYELSFYGGLRYTLVKSETYHKHVLLESWRRYEYEFECTGGLSGFL